MPTFFLLWDNHHIFANNTFEYKNGGSIMLGKVLLILQLFFTLVMGIYFFNMLKSQKSEKTGRHIDSTRELEKLHRLKEIRLTEPLAEKTRPDKLSEIIGQQDGIKALRAALCGPNPQHVLIYGPPGVGKTAAARVVLEEAIKTECSPFRPFAKFIEMDATTIRFDERAIADPLIGSVHDPIYQGAGAYGPAGIPQPKPGAVTKAHGGILFIDEIGELHPIQMNKLLKVLEDRKVFLESAYYSSGNKDIPAYIHEIFQKGLPADFRLVGATTRSPEEIPPAVRSRCVEIFFRGLNSEEVSQIASSAAKKGGFTLEPDALRLVGKFAQNGRDAVNLVQIAGSSALLDNYRRQIKASDIEWVAEFGHFIPRYEKKVSDKLEIGLVNGLAVTGANEGCILDVEAEVKEAKSKGTLTVTGIVETEEINARGEKLIKTSSAKASVSNMITVLEKHFGIDTKKYDIHVNFPGGMPVDGPSAGCAIITAVYSAIMQKGVDNRLAMTGEISIHGKIKPVGGICEKIGAAKRAGAKRVFIPKDNFGADFFPDGIEVIPVENISELFRGVFNNIFEEKTIIAAEPVNEQTLVSARNI